MDTHITISFLVLHYKEYDITRRCIDSLLSYENCKVYVVDNGSNNHSGEELSEFYKDNSRVKIFVSHEDWGFSRGNNWGFECIKELDGIPDFLIVSNNDIVFEQEKFIENLVKSYDKIKAAIIGPDILMFSNRSIHQNPLMLRARSKVEIIQYKNEVEKKLNSIDKILLDRKLKSIIKRVIRKKEKQHNLPDFDFHNKKANICLCGACLVFTPTFFEKYNEGLFVPETEFYHEEEILFYRLMKNGDFMLYEPELQVLHDHSVSTVNRFDSEKERMVFQYSNNIKSCSVLLGMLSNMD